MSQVWRVRLADQVERDLMEVVHWTAERFGRQQADVYAETLALAIEALHGGPDPVGAKRRDELGPGMSTLHVARHGRNGRHFVVFRVAEGHCIDVLRLLHDSMDLARHLPPLDDRPH